MRGFLKKIIAPLRKNIRQEKFTKECYQTTWFSAGEWSYGCPKVVRKTSQFNVRIGKFCSIAQNVKIFLDNNHRVDWITTYPLSKKMEDIPTVEGHPHGIGDVVIGNDVFIGQDVLIMSGVTIGDGAVVAARAVVTKNVAPYEIVGGIPAKHIKFRFPEEQIKQLLKIQWWNWPIDTIKENAKLLQSSNLKDFLKKFSVSR